ncbi:MULTISPECIES: hypothetical protein [unclassified Microcoleus]|uniref:hypothetical protein n=1 Tax=unclassified Microcoleus TaxID=2642155 RepID=UPI002FD65D48
MRDSEPKVPVEGGGLYPIFLVKSGIRCIATHLKPEPPSKSALTAMAVQLKQKSVGAGLGEGAR